MLSLIQVGLSMCVYMYMYSDSVIEIFIHNAANPVEIVLDQDNYTSVQVCQEANVKLDCSFVRSRFIQNRGIINPATSVSVRWFLKRENPDFMTLEEMTVQVMNMNPEQ